MQVQKIFIITPLGNKNSEARKHADRMWNEVLFLYPKRYLQMI